MDSETKIQFLKDYIQKFCEEREWDQFHTPKDLAIGLVTEAAELLEHFRFQSPEEIKQAFEDPKKRTQIAEELADSLFFILRFSQKNNIDLTTAVIEKMQKNAQKYPIERARGNNKKYTEWN